MLMGSGCTLSIRFAVPCPSVHPALADSFDSLQVQAGEVTKSAHPARFSPDDKYSSKTIFDTIVRDIRGADQGGFLGHRVTLKKRYGLLLTQNSECMNVRT